MENQDTHLLVVDDNDSNRDIISRKLRGKGYGVLVAEDGYRALQLVEQWPIDLSRSLSGDETHPQGDDPLRRQASPSPDRSLKPVFSPASIAWPETCTTIG